MSKATITATTALAVALTLLLSGCSSSNTTEKAKQEAPMALQQNHFDQAAH